MPFRIGPWELVLILLLLLLAIVYLIVRDRLKKSRDSEFHKHGGAPSYRSIEEGATESYNRDTVIIECPECGAKNQITQTPQPGKRYRCGKCHAEITLLKAVDTPIVKAEIHKTAETPTLATENTSGQGKLTVVPQEIRGWNWGAFLLGLIWGAGNNVWWSLLLFIPYFDMIWIIVMGVKGSEWAWKSKRWDSIEHFKSTQKKWRDWGIVIWAIIALIVFIIALS